MASLALAAASGPHGPAAQGWPKRAESRSSDLRVWSASRFGRHDGSANPAAAPTAPGPDSPPEPDSGRAPPVIAFGLDGRLRATGNRRLGLRWLGLG